MVHAMQRGVRSLLRLRMTETQVLLRAFESALAKKWKRTIVSIIYEACGKIHSCNIFHVILRITLYFTGMIM